MSCIPGYPEPHRIIARAGFSCSSVPSWLSCASCASMLIVKKMSIPGRQPGVPPPHQPSPEGSPNQQLVTQFIGVHSCPFLVLQVRRTPLWMPLVVTPKWVSDRRASRPKTTACGAQGHPTLTKHDNEMQQWWGFGVFTGFLASDGACLGWGVNPWTRQRSSRSRRKGIV